MKYLRSATFGSKDIVIRKSEFVTETQFLCKRLIYGVFFKSPNNFRVTRDTIELADIFIFKEESERKENFK